MRTMYTYSASAHHAQANARDGQEPTGPFRHSTFAQRRRTVRLANRGKQPRTRQQRQMFKAWGYVPTALWRVNHGDMAGIQFLQLEFRPLSNDDTDRYLEKLAFTAVYVNDYSFELFDMQARGRDPLDLPRCVRRYIERQFRRVSALPQEQRNAWVQQQKPKIFA